MPDVEGILWTPFMTIKKGGHEGITQHDVRKHPWRLNKNNTSKVSPGWVAPALTKEKKRKRSSLWYDVMMPWWSARSTCLSVRSFRGSQPSHFIELPHPHLSFHLSSLELNPCRFQALVSGPIRFGWCRNSGCAEIPQLSATQDDVFHRKTQLPGHTSGKS